MTHGPEPGTILNESGVPTAPRQAATVVVVRGGAERLEVLMVQRTPKARFMGGAWVFPGGAVDAHEGEGDEAHRAAAVREVEEEVRITLPDPAALVPFARWITPPEVIDPLRHLLLPRRRARGRRGDPTGRRSSTRAGSSRRAPSRAPRPASC